MKVLDIDGTSENRKPPRTSTNVAEMLRTDAI